MVERAQIDHRSSVDCQRFVAGVTHAGADCVPLKMEENMHWVGCKQNVHQNVAQVNKVFKGVH